MKSEKNKLTPDILVELKELATKLSPIPKVQKLKEGKLAFIYPTYNVLGSQILAEKKDAESQDGTPINPKKRYLITGKDPETVDHFKFLQEQYYHTGYKGVLEYCTQVRDKYKQLQEDKLVREELEEAKNKEDAKTKMGLPENTKY